MAEVPVLLVPVSTTSISFLGAASGSEKEQNQHSPRQTQDRKSGLDCFDGCEINKIYIQSRCILELEESIMLRRTTGSKLFCILLLDFVRNATQQ